MPREQETAIKSMMTKKRPKKMSKMRIQKLSKISLCKGFQVKSYHPMNKCNNTRTMTKMRLMMLTRKQALKRTQQKKQTMVDKLKQTSLKMQLSTVVRQTQLKLLLSINISTKRGIIQSINEFVANLKTDCMHLKVQQCKVRRFLMMLFQPEFNAYQFARCLSQSIRRAYSYL